MVRATTAVPATSAGEGVRPRSQAPGVMRSVMARSAASFSAGSSTGRPEPERSTER